MTSNLLGKCFKTLHLYSIPKIEHNRISYNRKILMFIDSDIVYVQCIYNYSIYNTLYNYILTQ